jgi:uncharacterized protein (TIGR01777 family)
LEFPAQNVFRWHSRPGTLERLNPPWEPVEVVERSGGVEDGSRAVMRVPIGPFRRLWVAEHRGYQEGREFHDVQIRGPFAYWDHRHRIEPDGPDACYLEDHIEYALPLGAIGRLLGAGLVRNKLDTAFAYRHRVLAQDLAAHSALKGSVSMNVLVTGSTGLVGSALVPFLTTGGHRVTRLVRSPQQTLEPTVGWDPEKGQLDAAALEGLDAVIHLAGESIAAGRWNAERKARIRDSRVKGTRLLSETLARLSRPPRTFLCASAIGYYGSRGDELLREDSSLGTGFLAEVCRDWEAAAAPAQDKGMRVVFLRNGVILSPRGGALAKMLFPFKMGGGGKVGNGQQYMSWIALDDVVGAIHHAWITESLQGPVNLVAPNPVTNLEFTKTLGRVLRRPTMLPLPAFAARLMFGELADALLLSSARVAPGQLLATNYAFRFPRLEAALRHLLGKPALG